MSTIQPSIGRIVLFTRKEFRDSRAAVIVDVNDSGTVDLCVFPTMEYDQTVVVNVPAYNPGMENSNIPRWYTWPKRVGPGV